MTCRCPRPKKYSSRSWGRLTSRVAPAEVSMGHIFRAVTPYIVMSMLLLALVFVFPGIALWLPALLG